MDVKQLDREINILERTLKREKGVRFILISALFILMIAFIAKDSSPIVILKDFSGKTKEWIKKDKASKEYLHNLTDQVINLAFNYTPKSAPFQLDRLLNIVSPESYGEMQKYIVKRKDEIQKNNTSSVFFPEQYSYDLENQKVIVRGIRVLFSGSQIISKEQKLYRLDFNTRNYLTSLDELVDVTNVKDPLNYKKNNNPNQKMEK